MDTRRVDDIRSSNSTHGEQSRWFRRESSGQPCRAASSTAHMFDHVVRTTSTHTGSHTPVRHTPRRREYGEEGTSPRARSDPKRLHELHIKNAIFKTEWKSRAIFCSNHGVADGIMHASMSSYSTVHLIREVKQTTRGRGWPVENAEEGEQAGGRRGR